MEVALLKVKAINTLVIVMIIMMVAKTKYNQEKIRN